MRFLKHSHPFIVAVRDMDLPTIKELVEEDTSLVNAQVRSDIGLTGKIWKDGKHVDITDDATQHAGALHYAAFHSQSELAQLLIDLGADVTQTADFGEADGRKFNAVYLAAWEGDTQTLKVFLDAAKADNVTLDLTPHLHSALAHTHQEKADLLLEYGAEHDISTAAQAGDHETLQRLIDDALADGPESLERDDWDYGRTPLEQALVVGQLKSAEILMAAGAKVSPQAATAMGRMDDVKRLIEQDSEALTGRFDKFPLLCWAIFCGQVNVVEFLLEAGADPNGADAWDVSPLRYATGIQGKNGVAIVNLLLNAGADVNQNARGMVPLHWAEEHSENPIAQAIKRHVDGIN